MINKSLQEWGRRVANGIVRPLAALGMTPNVVTVLGLILNMITAVIIASGHLTGGGIMLLAAGIFDMLDGALARVTGKSSVFGAFFDSTLDRIAEGAVGLGLLWYYTTHHNTMGVTLLYLVIVGSLMISYARARAEGLGLQCKVGLMARPERVIALGSGLIVGASFVSWVLLFLALSTWATVLQRIFHVWRAAVQAEKIDAMHESQAENEQIEGASTVTNASHLGAEAL